MTRRRFGAAVLAVAAPVAVVGVVESSLALAAAAAADRPYLARLAGTALLLGLAWSVPAGVVLGAVLARVPERALPRALNAVAAALAGGGCTLFLAANALLPRLGERQAEPAAALALAAAGAVVCGVARWALATDARAAGLAAGPAVLVAAMLGGYAALARWRIPGAPLVGLAAVGGAFVLARWLDRAWSRAAGTDGFLPAAAAPLAGLVLALAAHAAGRPTFPEIPPVPEGRTDVLVIVLDTTRADFAPASPGAPASTPVLDRLAAEGLRFTRAFSTSCWTLPAHGSLFTGLLPSEHGATWSSQRLPDGRTTLAERFAASGWWTGAASANPWITAEFGFGRGFDEFVVGDPDRRPWIGGVMRVAPWLTGVGEDAPLFRDASGRTLASEALRMLGSARGDRPALVFLNLLEPHLPYSPPVGPGQGLEGAGPGRAELDAIPQDRLADLDPRRRRTPREIDGLRRLYGGEVTYVDGLIGRIVGRLEQSGRLDSTVIVVTSDHGENLGQHPPLDHQLGLFDTLVRIPLLVRLPGRVPAGVDSDALVSLTDVHDAILDLAGIAPAAWPAGLAGGPGRDSVAFEYGRPDHILSLIRERLGMDPAPWDRTLRGIRSGTLKWIEASNGRHEAYDLSDDPGELRNLAGEPGRTPERFRPLAERLGRAGPVEDGPAVDTGPEAPSEETLERLRSLGYIP